jgi:glycopeptide antibiotics resistance protein
MKFNKRSREDIYKIMSYILFAIYIIILMNVLFFSDYYGRTIIKQGNAYNLKPFQEIKRFIIHRGSFTIEEWTTNLFGNILAFVPLGFFLPVLSKHYRKLFKILLSSAFLSLTVELLQLYYRVGIFDIDDLILNTFGGILGYISFIVVYKIFKLRRQKDEQKIQKEIK